MIHSQQIALLLALAVSVASAGPSLAQQDATKAGVAETALPPSKTTSLDTVGYDQTGKIVFSGRGPAGGKVQLNVDNNTYGLAVVDDKGTWTYAFLSPITVGTHTLRATEIGRDGTVKNRIQMQFYLDEPDKVATARLTPATPEAPKPAEAAIDEKTKAVVEEAIEKSNEKQVEEADRVPGLTYDDISQTSSKTPGKVLKKMASAALLREVTSQASGTRWAIQLASVRDPDEVKAEWRRLHGRFKDILKGKKLTVVRAHLGERGTFYRLRIGGFQLKSTATKTCALIRAKGGNCLAILIPQSKTE